MHGMELGPIMTILHCQSFHIHILLSEHLFPLNDLAEMRSTPMSGKQMADRAQHAGVVPVRCLRSIHDLDFFTRQWFEIRTLITIAQP